MDDLPVVVLPPFFGQENDIGDRVTLVCILNMHVVAVRIQESFKLIAE